MEQIDLFRKDLEALGIIPVLENDTLSIEYPVDSVDQKAVTKLFNQYVGFWKSIGIKHNHSREERIARYTIPVALIGGEDLTEDQLFALTEQIQKRLGSITTSQISDMKHAIGYRSDRVIEGTYYAFRNFFGVSKEAPEWEDLVLRGLATKRMQFEEVVYHVSDEGLKLLSEVLNVEIIPTEQ